MTYPRVIPAKAGIHLAIAKSTWIPVFTRMTMGGRRLVEVSSVLGHRAIQFEIAEIDYYDIAFQYFRAKSNRIFFTPNFRANGFTRINRRSKTNALVFDSIGLVAAERFQ